MIRLELFGMTCADCAEAVDRALAAVPGVRRVAVDYEAALAEVWGDADPGDLIAAVRAAGYEARLKEAGEPAAAVKNASPSPDLVVIGSGSAGVAAALEAAGRGARVWVVESGALGGTCVNVGCVPSKTLLRAGEAAERARRTSFPGVRPLGVEVDFPAVAAARDRLVATLRKEKYEDVLAAAGVRLVRGRARFTDGRTLVVDGEPVAARAFLLATGAEPRLPPVPGLAADRVWTYREAATARELPESLLVIGAGAVGLELAQAYRRLGSRVTVLEAQPRILPAEDAELAGALQAYLEAEGIRIRTGVRVERVEHDGGFCVRTPEGDFEAERLLVAAGRCPRTGDLGLDAAGVALDEQGFVRVDERLATSNPRIYAAGDVAGLPQFVYVAAQSGRLAAGNALGANERLDLRAVPRVTFTDPAIAGVGLTEIEARARFGEGVRSARLDLRDLPRALAAFDPRGFLKIVVDRDGTVLGLHVLAPEAGEVIEEGVIAVQSRSGYRDLIARYHPYLTLSEGVRLVAQALDQDVHRLSCCA
ncbi:mercury(II) reductase [Deinococcota bacterium DY0809b]